MLFGRLSRKIPEHDTVITATEMPSWHATQWAEFQRGSAQDRVPHGKLLYGASGLGKLEFTQLVAAALLCTDVNDANRPCGLCSGCTLFNAGNHPDFSRVEPEEGKKSIGVDQIRRRQIGPHLPPVHASHYRSFLRRGISVSVHRVERWLNEGIFWGVFSKHFSQFSQNTLKQRYIFARFGELIRISVLT